MAHDLKICSLYSGSTGNATYIESPDARILIDAGKSAKALCEALASIGSSIKTVDAIFVTHEHTDHVSALGIISKKLHIPIHATEACGRVLADKCEFIADCLVNHAPLYSVKLGDLEISSFLTSHDSACPVGYKIVSDGGDTFGLMTDSGVVTNSAAAALTGCRSALIESNHDLEMLQNGPYPQVLKDRVASKFGHISNETSARFAAYLADNGTENIILGHLSPQNNIPQLALECTERALVGKNCTVRVATPDKAVFMYDGEF